MQNMDGRILRAGICHLSSAQEHITGLDDSVLVLIRFKIGGSVRFLSHAETLKVFQRACVRAGMNIQYTQGFNPRPRLSLPLPRPVGVASEDDLLCVRLLVRDASCVMPRARETPSAAERAWEAENVPNTQHAISNTIMAGLSEQLPEGFELLSVSVAEAGSSFQPRSAIYVLPVCREYLTDALQARIKHVLESESLKLDRRIGPERQDAKFRSVDVRSFLKSIQLEGDCVVIECTISPVGSIRVEEILQLLELDVDKLSAPVRRTSVQWHKA